jgi:hypothetical protein
MRQRGRGERREREQPQPQPTDPLADFTISPFWDCDVGRLRRRRRSKSQVFAPALASCYENHKTKRSTTTPHVCMSGRPTDLVVHTSQLCAFARSSFLVFSPFFPSFVFFVFVLGDHMHTRVQYRYVIEDERRTKKNVTPPFFLTFSDMSTDLWQPACALPPLRPILQRRIRAVSECDDRLEGRTR